MKINVQTPRLILLYCSFIFLCHCTTTQEPTTPYDLPKSNSSYDDLYSKPGNENSYNDIDIDSLVNELHMNSPFTKIGFIEKSFNSCQIKSNRSKKPLCRRLYLGKVNYHVMCRRSTGTVQKVTLRPLNQSQLRWKRGPYKGYTKTNASGFGTIYFISKKPSNNKAMYLYLGHKVARKRLQDMWKLILPNSWCIN